MQFLKQWSASVNRWQMYKFTALAVAYGMFIVILTGPVQYQTAVMVLAWSHPFLAFLTIYGFTFRRANT